MADHLDLPVPNPKGEQTIIDVLDRVAAAYPDREAYVDGDQRVTFGQLAARSSGLAALMQDRGVRHGDVVAIRLPTSIEYALSYLAAARLGAVTTGINPRLGRREVDGIVARAKPVLTVIEDADIDTPSSAASLRRSEVSAVAPGDPAWRPEVLAADDPVAIVWTSGTTGLPKGAVFDHRNLEALSRATGEMSAPLDVRLSPVPFAHVGYMTRVWDEIGNGMTSVIVPTPWSASTALDLIEAQRVTVGQGVPTQWELILRQPDLDRRDTSSMRMISTGAARVPAALVFALEKQFGCPVVVRYATTEASVVAGTLRGDPPEVIESTVGGPCPTVEVRIADPDGAPVPPGEVGMIEVRSGAVMRGYLGDEHPSPIRPDGWLVTGDAGSLDPGGRIRLVGRQSEMYIRGGYNVYPLEVEQVLSEHPSVAEVAVAGAHDGVLGMRGVAWVVPAAAGAGASAGAGAVAPELDELRAWCKSQLADYKAPDRLVVVDALPRNQMGKVDKKALLDGWAG